TTGRYLHPPQHLMDYYKKRRIDHPLSSIDLTCFVKHSHASINGTNATFADFWTGFSILARHQLDRSNCLFPSNLSFFAEISVSQHVDRKP
ncbi:hypothetical protein T310_10171, partial [Rasamsonia emersonii CBS 393.64]